MAKKLLRIFLILAPLAVLAVGANWFYRVTNAFTDSKTSPMQVLQAVNNPRSQFPGVNKMTMLLVGQDYNHDKSGRQFTKNSRADTIMLMSVDLDTKKISAVSVPRDTKVHAPDGKTGKINGTYSRGGIEMLKQTLEETLGVTIDHYVIVKSHAVQKIVDAIGGIEVETIDAMNYDDDWGGLHIHLPAGKQRLNGQQAVGFVRFREVNRYKKDARGRMIRLKDVQSSKEEGDLRRVARQQQFVRALLHEADSPGNLWKADSIINTGFEQIETSFSKTQVLALATIFRGTGGETMNSGTLPGTDDMTTGAYYYVLDEDKAKATVDWLIKGDEQAAKKLVRISIKNSTQIKGVAKIAADILSEDGYSAKSDGNEEALHPTTEVVYYKAAHEVQAKAIQSLLGIPSIRKEASSPAYTGPEIKIVIGSDIAQSLSDKAHPQKLTSR